MGQCLDELLFEGEEVEKRTTVGAGEIAVTTHRVLVVTPEEGTGATERAKGEESERERRSFDHADRPNVVGAAVRSTGEETYLDWGVRSGVYGVALLSGGYLLKHSGVFGVFSNVQADGSSEPTGVIRLATALSGASETLTGLLLLVGVLAVVAAGALLYRYSDSRSRELVIELAGREPIRIPVDEGEGERAVAELRAAL